MSSLNAMLRAVFDTALSPFRDLHPLVGLTVLSAVFGVLMLYVYKLTSNQDRLAAVKRQIHASLFEIRLFNDDLPAILRAQRDILRHNLSYLRCSLTPLLWMLVPMILMIGQLLFHYGYRGLKPGERTLFKVELSADWQTRLGTTAARPPITLQAPPGLLVEAGPVWIPTQHELVWRIRAADWGDYDVQVHLASATVSKNVQVKADTARRSPVRPSAGFFDQLLYPAEAALPSALPIQAISIAYPPANAGISGWDSEWTWMLVFFVLTIVFALILRKPFGVTF